MISDPNEAMRLPNRGWGKLIKCGVARRATLNAAGRARDSHRTQLRDGECQGKSVHIAIDDAHRSSAPSPASAQCQMSAAQTPPHPVRQPRTPPSNTSPPDSYAPHPLPSLPHPPSSPTPCLITPHSSCARSRTSPTSSAPFPRVSSSRDLLLNDPHSQPIIV